MVFDKCLEVIVHKIRELPLADRVELLNRVRLALHEVSPFKDEPVDCVQWVPAEFIEANDYNPNTVAPPEMELLELSIMQDGYTQPIVSWEKEDRFEVVDGFHRNRVGRECEAVAERVKGYLPLTVIREEREGRGNRIASTIRHNRARGKHGVQSMSDIVVELKRRNWSDKKIAKELGMDPDEVLRLSQISGLAEMFTDTEFTEAWESSDPFATEESIGGPVSELEPVEYEPPGWQDRSDNKSILYGEQNSVLARLTKSNGKWGWAAYTTPMVEGVAANREEAKCNAEAAISGK